MKILNTNLYNCFGHLSDYAYTMLTSGRLTIQSRVEVLKHIACCEECAEKIAQGFDDSALIAVPSDFALDICSYINTSETNRQRNSFALYCARLAVAVCITLTCIYSGVFNTTINFIQQEIPIKSLSIKAPDLSFSNKIVEDLSSFTNKLIKMEGFNNAKKER
jgi:hypothetical protein